VKIARPTTRTVVRIGAKTGVRTTTNRTTNHSLVGSAGDQSSNCSLQ
jgi:hypothetical protein